MGKSIVLNQTVATSQKHLPSQGGLNASHTPATRAAAAGRDAEAGSSCHGVLAERQHLRLSPRCSTYPRGSRSFGAVRKIRKRMFV